jgi:hypothetical protein
VSYLALQLLRGRDDIGLEFSQPVLDDSRLIELLQVQYCCGWAHADARSGDQILLLEGGSVPAILPKLSDKDGLVYDRYSMIGDVYLAGAMQGHRGKKVLYRKEKEKGKTRIKEVEVEYIYLR